MTKNKDWFRIKKYSHIGLPLSVKDKTWVDAYVQNSSNISKHSFFPFIHRTIKSRKFRKEYDKETDNLLNNGKRIKGIKEREIYYANHLDSNIFSYYSSLLSKLYESELITRNLHNVVTAYRHIKHPKKNRGMNNVDFANEVFQYIRSSSEKKIIAITFDIKSFFDNLSHKRIKESWKNLLKCKSLPDDHYNVFKNITNFSFIEHKDIFNEFKNELIKKDKLGKLIKNKVDKIKYMKNHEIIAFCKTEDFDTRIRKNNLIKSNKKISNDNENFMIRNKGIPQGSPISSLLANLYLLNFDLIVNNEILDIGGLYRRYSDDIIIICKEEYMDYFRNFIINKIKEYELEIQEKKTNCYLFQKDHNSNYKCFKYLPNKLYSNKRRFEYLGFEFDGKYIYIRSCSLAKYYRNMIRSVKRGGFYSKYSKYKEGYGQIFRRRLYKRFSYIGAKRKLLWKYDMKTNKWVKERKHDWGNYITYVNMAHFNMRNSKIKYQIRNHWNYLNKLIKDVE